jgi:hypothetical protein
MIKWISLLFDRSKKEAKEQEIKKAEELQYDLKKMTKGDLKKLYAQGKIKSIQLKP